MKKLIRFLFGAPDEIVLNELLSDQLERIAREHKAKGGF